MAACQPLSPPGQGNCVPHHFGGWREVAALLDQVHAPVVVKVGKCQAEALRFSTLDNCAHQWILSGFPCDPDLGHIQTVMRARQLVGQAGWVGGRKMEEVEEDTTGKTGRKEKGRQACMLLVTRPALLTFSIYKEV